MVLCCLFCIISFTNLLYLRILSLSIKIAKIS
nr:MAG TPA: hypothetical protein [Caudoviricetes sp.]